MNIEIDEKYLLLVTVFDFISFDQLIMWITMVKAHRLKVSK